MSEILSQAAKVLGSAVAADAGMTRKAIGLDNKTPLEMMMTAEGTCGTGKGLSSAAY
jgi:uncharacterized protein (DUF2384 family)